jgi:hypothetical protein
MDKLIIKAKSSLGDFYLVSFTLKDGLLRIKCDCKAGSFMQGCKHKFAFLKNDSSILFDPEEMPDFIKAVEWIKASLYPPLMAEIGVAETVMLEHKRILKNLYRKLEEGMKRGY